MLEKIDLSKGMKRKEWKAAQPEFQRRLYDLQKAAFDNGMPVIILFEGWDGSGKGTSINMLTQRLDARGFKVWPVRAARTYEKNHPWLWRFWLKLPNRGQIAIFDRSWYGRVLVERVEGLAPEEEWQKAYRDITEFERMLADDGHVIIKFWFHISRKEQRKRFKTLEKDPLQSWHIQPEDWEHHRKYERYLKAVEEMLERTETEWAPWTIVEATNQYYTWWTVFSTIVNSLDAGLRARGIDPTTLSEEAVTASAAAAQASGPAAGPSDGTASAGQPAAHAAAAVGEPLLMDATNPAPEA
jgi:polyphosphate kinase 2 (PPK2 family)